MDILHCIHKRIKSICRVLVWYGLIYKVLTTQQREVIRYFVSTVQRETYSFFTHYIIQTLRCLCVHLCFSGQLPLEHLRGKPLCMELYPLLFSSCRIPGPKHDQIAHYGRARRSPTHITVVRNYQVG